MARVTFDVRHRFDAAPKRLWDTMVDWQSHGDWIPATRMEVQAGDPTAIGAEFTGFTGFGPLTLEDRMVVTRCDWDDAARSGDCSVDKVGPVLRGRAWFEVRPDGDGATIAWFEDITVPYTPQFLAPVVGKLTAAGFAFGMRRLAKHLDDTEN